MDRKGGFSVCCLLGCAVKGAGRGGVDLGVEVGFEAFRMRLGSSYRRTGELESLEVAMTAWCRERESYWTESWWAIRFGSGRVVLPLHFFWGGCLEEVDFVTIGESGGSQDGAL